MLRLMTLITFRKSLLFLAALFCLKGESCHAQTVDSLKLDTLITVLTLEKKDVRTVNAYVDLADEYIRVTDYPIGLTYAGLAKDMAAEIEYKEGELEATIVIAHLYLAYYLDFKASIVQFDHAFDLANELNSDADLLIVYRGYANVYAGVMKFEKAIEFNQKAIDLASQLGLDQTVSDLSAYSGSMYEELGDTAKAIQLYSEVEQIEQENNFVNTSNVALVSIAHYYWLIGDVDKSVKLYRSALTRFERLQDNRWVSYTHAELANIYISTKDFERAEKHALKGLDIAQTLDLNKERGDNYKVLANIYSAKGDMALSEKYQKAYDDLMDSVVVELEYRDIDVGLVTSSSPNSSKTLSRWLTVLSLLGLIGFVVLLAGMPSKKAK